MMYLPANTVLGSISFWQKSTLELAQSNKKKILKANDSTMDLNLVTIFLSEQSYIYTPLN